MHGLSYGAIWRISRKNRNWKADKSHLTQCLSPANKGSRLAACTFCLSFEMSGFGELLGLMKSFVLKQSPNKQTYRHWALSNPHTFNWMQEDSGWKSDGRGGGCRRANTPCCLFWRVGKFECILGACTQNTAWDSVKSLATRREYCFQHNGASCHVTIERLEFLQSKFRERIISSPFTPLTLRTCHFSFLLFSIYGTRH